MKNFQFGAPMLFDASAKVDASTEMHDAPAAAQHLAKIKNFAIWLKSELVEKGIATQGPGVDEGGWIVMVSPKGGVVHCILSSNSEDDTHLSLIVMEPGSGGKYVGDVVDEVLSQSSQINNLKRL